MNLLCSSLVLILFFYADQCRVVAMRADLISTVPYVAIFPEFLSLEECNKIIEHAQSSVQYKGNGDDSVYFDHYPRLPPWLQEIERRMGAIANSPPHPGEEPINIHHIKRFTAYEVDKSGDVASCIIREDANSMDKCRVSARGIHHDKVQKEFSSVTVLIYLNDIEEGGGTVWPCISQYSNSTQINTACSQGFDLGSRWYDGDAVVTNGVYRKHPPSPEEKAFLDQILIGAHYGCLARDQQPSWIVQPAFTTKPRMGTAAVFWHNLPNLMPDKQAWHGGCAPLSGDKWTLQKFKEIPEQYRDLQREIVSGAFDGSGGAKRKKHRSRQQSNEL